MGGYERSVPRGLRGGEGTQRLGGRWRSGYFDRRLCSSLTCNRMSMTANELVNRAIGKILSDAPDATTHKEPTISLRGLLAKYGTAPSTEEIDQNRVDIFRNFPRSDF